MKMRCFLIVAMFCGIAALYADTHPKAAEIQKYINANPIDTIMADIVELIDPQSMELNKVGFKAYSEGDFVKALELFLKATDVDANNSIAWYNAACCYSLDFKCMGQKTSLLLAKAVNIDWFWGLQLFVDSDLDGERIVPGTEITGYEFIVRGPENSCTYLHKLYQGGIVKIFEDCNTQSNMGEGARYVPIKEVAVGYYCIIGAISGDPYIFEFFPQVTASSIFYMPFYSYTMEKKLQAPFDVFAVPYEYWAK